MQSFVQYQSHPASLTIGLFAISSPMFLGLCFLTIDYLYLYCICPGNVYEDLPCDPHPSRQVASVLREGRLCVVPLVAGDSQGSREYEQWLTYQGVVVYL